MQPRDRLISHIKDKILSDDTFSQNILYYGRFVHNILYVWNGSDDIFHRLLHKMNNFHQNMKFTTEISGNLLNFLDLSLRLISDSTDLNVESLIYRKETSVCLYIQQHPPSASTAIINHAVHQSLHLPLSTEDYNKKFGIIEGIARKNGLYIDIRQMIEKKLNPTLCQANVLAEIGGSDSHISVPSLTS